MPVEQIPWWQRATIYQVYPRSFQDTDGDGVGDLRGIISRLPYFAELGVDAIWLSPIFRSPMKDFGYDVSNYVDIDPLFGTMGDFDTLLEAAHKQGLRLLLDFVPNHTSDQHPWFDAKPILAAEPQARLVSLARPSARWRATQQLAIRIRRKRLAIR